MASEALLQQRGLVGDVAICWQANAKLPGTKCHDRYTAYSKSKTVAEARALGARARDLNADFDKGYLKFHEPAPACGSWTLAGVAFQTVNRL